MEKKIDQNQVYFDFDIEVDNSIREEYKLLMDIPLRDSLSMKKGFGPIKARSEDIKFTSRDGKKCMDISNHILIIPTHNNIKTKSGRISMEIFPLNNIKDKQYLFIHNNIQYPSSTISIWIENNNIYLHDINGIRAIQNIKLIQNSWNNIEVDFNGSFYNCDNIYISDIQQPFEGYIRNIKTFKK